MGKSSWLEIVSGSEKGVKATAARAVLRALSVPFGAAVSGRRWLYEKGALSARRASIPVISVGNITVGGTGKTPLVEYVARRLSERGHRPAIVMRGYGARYGGSPGEAGSSDEARLLRRNLGAGVRVIEDADRFRGTETAAGRYGCNVAVLDDGFQHIQLERDLDVVCIDATSPFGFGKLFPAGALRESPEALARADVVVITRSDLPAADEIELLDDRVRGLAPEALVMKSVFAPSGLEVADGSVKPPVTSSGAPPRSLPVERIEGARVAAFCGIGNPGAFGLTIRRLGGEVVMTKRFPDHHPYTPEELAEIARAAEAGKARFCLTTQKDAARIPGDAWPRAAPPLYVLRAEFAFVERERAFWDLVELTLDRAGGA